MTERVPRAARWTIACVALLVPEHGRRAWRRRWTAELEHRCAARVPLGGVFRFALGSVAHAVFLRREEMTVRGWAGDIRHSVRALTQHAGFTLLTILTFAIGSGAPTGIFSLAEAALLRPLPMEDGDRLVRIYSTNGDNRFSVSSPDFVDFTSRTDLFEAASFYANGSSDVSDGENPERIAVASVHESFFQTLKTLPAVGRVFTLGDHDPAAPAAVVLAEDFWNRRFGADATMLGQTVCLDGERTS